MLPTDGNLVCHVCTGKRKGRCNDDDIEEFLAQLGPACKHRLENLAVICLGKTAAMAACAWVGCGADGSRCADIGDAGIDSAGRLTLATPIQDGELYCAPECAEVRSGYSFLCKHQPGRSV